MASTGTALWPGASTFPDTNVYPGQGNLPLLRVHYSTDDAVDADPLWVDATTKVLAFSTSRGREDELGEVDAGTATITLDNRLRTFDPVSNASIRPMNRWRIVEEFTGETQAIFVGYADSYQQEWPAPVGDATTVVACTDEFKVLSLGGLATTSPPRNSYGDLVNADEPAGYWPMDDDPSTLVQSSPPPPPPPEATPPGSIPGYDPNSDIGGSGWAWKRGGWS